MTKTPGSSGDLRKWTWSAWVKRGTLANGSQTIFNGGSSNNTQLRFDSDDTLNFYQYSGGYTARLATTQTFRDPGAWMHVVAHWDSDNAAAGDRMKLFVNGTEVTAFGTDTNPALNLDSYFGESGTAVYVGDKGDGAEEMDGYLAEVCFIDGQNLAPTSFGEFNTDSPTIWQPIDIAGLTPGTNGFYLDFEDSANLGNDAFGGTDFTENNIVAADQATDTPSNNFCTMNPLQNRSLLAYSEGNNQIVGYGDGYGRAGYGTMALSAGKWYFEFKVNSTVPGNTSMGIANVNGINAQSSLRFNPFGSGTGYTYGYKHVDGNKVTSGTASSYGNTYTQNDIMSCAFDLENLKIYFAKNGTWQDSGDPTSGATGTGSAFDLQSGENYMPAQQFDNGPTIQYNFGGCSAFDVASANQDGNGYGNFEYAVPSGYLALCTKNLGSDGG